MSAILKKKHRDETIKKKEEHASNGIGNITKYISNSAKPTWFEHHFPWQ